MTIELFREDAYLRDAPAMVHSITQEGGIVLDRSVFYPTGGGQPGDSGRLSWPGGAIGIATAVRTHDGAIALVPSEPGGIPEPGTQVEQALDWDRRHRHMRVHTALHLLSVVLPFGVTGGSIAATHGRLDFDMADAPQDKAEIEARLNDLVAQDLRVAEQWITEDELDANPGLVKTMAVMPPRGTGRIRLVRIGAENDPVDLQPCGGTHVARLGEIGLLRLGKIEKKGRMNRRVYVHLDS
ncbi:alanyl-tRNA editing protein [Sulfitobacter sp. D35]|uniref:alanyl-tRNA editing protein n=1 Tax=Sulfitobacter sp. D35 TaxID=3083252 RepID=UPI00296FB9D0|nr:alanyl-tRNA editing protein [Sulfitobacter sp. D35]MDW4496411.1 alanyl-tRNA editing protein [Sulfitobacter sp. D35]